MSRNKDYFTLLIMYLTGISLIIIACVVPTVNGIVAFALFLVGIGITADVTETLLDGIKKNNERSNNE